MSSEAQLILGVWEVVRDHLPHGKRAVIAQDLLYAFQEYGFESGDCTTIIDEDPDLAAAFDEVFLEDDDDESDGA